MTLYQGRRNSRRTAKEERVRDKCLPLKAATTLLRADAEAEGGPPEDGGFVDG
jgi:hypothetical protein